MFYNKAGGKAAVVLRRGGATKYSPATTKKFIFFQLRRASKQAEGRFSLVKAGEGLSTPLALS